MTQIHAPRRSLLLRTDAGLILPLPTTVTAVTAAVVAAPGAEVQAAAEPSASGVPVTEYSIMGYRQTEKPASQGGRANENGFRFRHKALRAIARTARNQPFITGHNWGDVRARGGTILEGGPIRRRMATRASSASSPASSAWPTGPSKGSRPGRSIASRSARSASATSSARSTRSRSSPIATAGRV
jgi:hypothetical protein